MAKFKKGDRVYDREAGLPCVILGVMGDEVYDGYCFCDASKGALIQFDNGHVTWNYIKYLDLFIEPKFKVGYKFKTRLGDVFEVVKVALNKKKNTTTYLCFNIKNGNSGCIEEENLVKLEKNEKVEEMTLDQICSALGKKIKIKK